MDKKEGKRAISKKRVIQLLITHNPKRKNTRAWLKFELLLGFHGKTVGEYCAEEGKHPEIDDYEEGWAMTELRWARDRNAAKIVDHL